MPPLLLWPCFLPAAYLVGSIPFGFLIARARGVDIRAHGSGNIGATNVGRVLGKRLGALCFALDVLKGLLPTLAAGFLSGAIHEPSPTPQTSLAWLAVAAATIAGHMFPVWLGFKGGKGVATGFGALLGVFPVLTIAAAGTLVVWLISARITRYVGVSSCLGAVSLPVFTLAAGLVRRSPETPLAGSPGPFLSAFWPYLLVTVLLAALVLYKHRGNIRRTLAGTEPRLGSPRPATPSSAAAR